MVCGAAGENPTKKGAPLWVGSGLMKKDEGLKQDDQDQENIGTAADIRQDKCTYTDYTGQQSMMGAWSRTRVSLAHCPSIPMTHSSVANSFTCLYIYTSEHQFLRSSISCVRSSSHVPSPYLCVHSQVHPSTAAHATGL